MTLFSQPFRKRAPLIRRYTPFAVVSLVGLRCHRMLRPQQLRDKKYHSDTHNAT
jgi:hypothetical protein